MTHPDTGALAEFRAGLITGRRGAAIAAHVAGCGRCSALGGRLAEVSALLAAIPAPAMPDNVARRLDAALAAEAGKRDDAERTGRASTPEPGSPDRQRAKNRGFRLLTRRVLVPAAAVIVLAAGGYGVSRIGSGPGSRTVAGGAASSPAASGALHPAGASALPAMGPAAYLPVVTSRVSLSPARLVPQLEAVLRGQAGVLVPASAQMRGCVQNVAGDAVPLRVVTARYQGRPATVIVARDGSGDIAWVAGPRCSATDRDVLATAMLPGI